MTTTSTTATSTTKILPTNTETDATPTPIPEIFASIRRNAFQIPLNNPQTPLNSAGNYLNPLFLNPQRPNRSIDLNKSGEGDESVEGDEAIMEDTQPNPGDNTTRVWLLMPWSNNRKVVTKWPLPRNRCLSRVKNHLTHRKERRAVRGRMLNQAMY